MKTPVVLILYNRPDLTGQVFERIREARPPRLFLIADGPGNAEDAVKCRQAREAVAEIDWPCEVIREFSETNMGCKRRVAGGLDGVFGQVEEAIILEDDCLPHLMFFRFCEELLERYRDEPRVMHIGGADLRPRVHALEASYYFSRYPSIWGWACWRRAWEHYDVAMSKWPAVKAAGGHYRLFATKAEARHFEQGWDEIYHGRLDTWDGQWLFAVRMMDALTIAPDGNMVSNVGFGTGATHTRDTEHPFAELPVKSMVFPLRHPRAIACYERADRDRARAEFLRRQGWMWQLIMKLSNKHFYGALIRKMPLIGRLWSLHRRQYQMDNSE